MNNKQASYKEVVEAYHSLAVFLEHGVFALYRLLEYYCQKSDE